MQQHLVNDNAIVMKIPVGLPLITLVSFLILMYVVGTDSEHWRVAFAAIGFVGFLIMTISTLYLIRRRSRR